MKRNSILIICSVALFSLAGCASIPTEGCLRKDFNRYKKSLHTDEGAEMMRQSIENGDLTAVSCMLDAGFDVDTRLGAGRTPLMTASLFQQKKVVDFLLSRKADPNAQTSSSYGGVTPLILAIGQGDLEITKKLLDAGANPNIADAEGRTPLIAAEIRKELNIPLLETMLNSGADIHAISDSGFTLFGWAVENNDMDVVKYLIQKGVKIDGTEKERPLLESCMKGNYKMVEFLCENGANVNVSLEDGTTPLMVSLDYPEIITYLINHKAKTEQTNSEDLTALMLAAIKDKSKAIAPLVNGKANVNGKDPKGLSPLMYATMHDNIDTAKELLKYGANPNYQISGDVKLTPLITAAVKASPEMVQLLLSKGAKPNTKDQEGNTALGFAIHEDNPEVVAVLLKNGADVYSRNKKGVTVFYEATINGHEEIVEMLFKHIEKSKPTLAQKKIIETDKKLIQLHQLRANIASTKEKLREIVQELHGRHGMPQSVVEYKFKEDWAQAMNNILRQVSIQYGEPLALIILEEEKSDLNFTDYLNLAQPHEVGYIMGECLSNPKRFIMSNGKVNEQLLKTLGPNLTPYQRLKACSEVIRH